MAVKSKKQQQQQQEGKKGKKKAMKAKGKKPAEPLVALEKQTKKKYGSRSKKKNIRKHTEILLSAVETHRDEVSHEMRTGGLVHEAPDEALFAEMVTPMGDTPQVGRKFKARQKAEELRTRYHPSSNKFIKAVRTVKPTRSKAARKPGSSASGSTGITGSAAPAADAKQKNKNKNKKKQEEATQVQEGSTADEPVFDIWASEEHTPKLKQSKSQRKGPETVLNQQAVERPLQGQSYNPEYDAHRKLIAAAAATEILADRRQARLQRRAPRAANVNPAAAQRDQMVQVARDLERQRREAAGEDRDDDSDEGEEGDGDSGLEVPEPGMERTKKVTERKTKAQRNRQLRHERRMRRQQARKRHRLRMRQYSQLKPISKALDEQDERYRRRREHRQRSALDRLARPRRLSKFQIKQPPLPVKLTDELTPSLRQMKPEGNVFRERIFSMVRRNIIEYREKSKRTIRRKRKSYENRAHKNFAHAFDSKLESL
ncbi:hypothetical protein PTSG_05801 [Salpingoeca rosetta]|uniref:Ribosome biogenesis protein NOP53 n=1 Tax=Salpingoeca rosetta (strain ATCC 50818 / BSB-021) TaxID=946362 RepID=F2UCU1_SALR5|nr:uncharacterized protein PTSG_05801 [Salpingoeca rosetta]EGD74436.1 hypothetical protein PTSG_05801 [Salpingoeca rosetta]|eukprot:XP_004992693.1 hypothetical protein PTSG_05801 [Salpingoeca rosetta]